MVVRPEKKRAPVEKAQGLSYDIDSVLAKEGFSVKSWISNKDMSKGNEKEKISNVMEVFEGGAEVDMVLGITELTSFILKSGQT